MSRFSLSSDCRRQLIWRESGTAYRPENIQEKDRYPNFSIMVWAGIMINGRTRLHVVANGTMTGQRYIDEVLFPHVRLFRGAVGDKFVFMDDNATCHRTLAVQDCLDSEGIQRLVWPARSPDLNPIENVWDALGRQVAGRNYHPTNKNTLIRALTEERDKLPQQLLDNVVQSMVRLVECCITLHGGHIPGVGTNGSEKCHLYEDQAQDALDGPVVDKIATSDESRFKLSSHDHRVRVWRPRRQRLNPSFALQPYTSPVAGVMVWGAIAYNTRSPLVLIRDTMSTQRGSFHKATRNCNRTIRTSTKEEIVIFLEQVLPELLDDVHASTVTHPCVLCGAIKMEPTPIEAFLFHLNATFDQRWSGHGGSMHRPTQ
ncbi:uncharacterized protein TNCV_2975981 [Trichonephila clavipes]|nr:uncharacterized protein TNCV_2975981 [Trichonephila clavipes]